MQQYFIKNKIENPITITDADTIKHMFNVMRLVDGDQVILVFDDHIKRLAQIVDSQAHVLKIVKDLPADNVEMPIHVTIASGFPKGDKLEMVTQKATELGASQIWSFPADWSVVKWNGKKLAKKVEKLRKIALGAAQQSKRNCIPSVSLFEEKKDFLAQIEQFDVIVVAYEESAKKGETAMLAKVFSTLEKNQKVLFVFGPEGGISPDEIAVLEDKGAILCGLGPRIMRAETAPLYVLAALSFATEML